MRDATKRGAVRPSDLRDCRFCHDPSNNGWIFAFHSIYLLCQPFVPGIGVLACWWRGSWAGNPCLAGVHPVRRPCRTPIPGERRTRGFNQPGAGQSLTQINLDRINQLLITGRAQYLYGDYSIALKSFKDILAIDPGNLEAQAYESRIMAMSGNPVSPVPGRPGSNPSTISLGTLAARRMNSAVPDSLPSLTTPLVSELRKGAPFQLEVPATSDPWLTGTPGGSMASTIDIAPDHSPVFVAQVRFGQVLAFSTSGTVGIKGGQADHSGGGEIVTHEPENGLAGLSAPTHSLIGVFLDDNSPITNLATAINSYSVGEPVVQPGLRQPFYIGDGRMSSGEAQQIVVPEGATRFYLGTMGTGGWANKHGAFQVKIEVLREPGKVGLLMIYGSACMVVMSIMFMTLRKKRTRGDNEEFFFLKKPRG